jgi:SAM-dependent methyltransferase
VDCDLSPEDPGLGGYDASYRQCPCFWGTEPGTIVRLLATLADLTGARVLDLGCGEGKNAVFLAQLGCKVEAWDISERALANAKRAWPAAPVLWRCKDAVSVSAEMRKFDLILAYGLFHCLPNSSIAETISHMQRITERNGYNIAVCFNDRNQINTQAAHPSFASTCLPHNYYQLAYSDWQILHDTDADLVERHPTNSIEHTHSMTRILARKVIDVERSS